MSYLRAFLKHEFVNASYFKYTLPIKDYYLIQWFPKSWTLIHGHNNNNCKFITLNGSLEEKRYSDKNDTNSLIEINEIKAGKLYFIDDNLGYHQMKNNNEYNIWSIHKYYQ